MSSLKSQMDNLLKNGVVDRHSYFQLKYFVVGKEPTMQAKMWRCIRELKSRKESLDAIELEIEEVKDTLELAEIEIERLEQPLENSHLGYNPLELDRQRKEWAIKLRRAERHKRAHEATLKQLQKKKLEIEEEATFFLKTFQALEQREPLKPFDDLEEQLKYWNEKLSQLINLKVLLRLPLDTELVQTILSLGDESPIKKEVVSLLDHQRLLIENKSQET